MTEAQVGGKRAADGGAVPAAAGVCVECGVVGHRHAALSCGCADRCGACAGAMFLDALPRKCAPEFKGFCCLTCEKAVEFYSVGARMVHLAASECAVMPPWQAEYNVSSAAERTDSVSISLSATASDGSVRVFGGTYFTGEDDHEPSGALRADLVRICMYIGSIIGLGQETVATPICENVNDYARAAIADTGLFHQCIRALVLVSCAFAGDCANAQEGAQDNEGGCSAADATDALAGIAGGDGAEFDASPKLPTIKDLVDDGRARHETCGVWTIVNVVRKLRNPRMVSGAPGFISRAVCNHDANKVASVLSTLGLGVSHKTLARADTSHVEKLMGQDLPLEEGDMLIGGFDNMVLAACPSVRHAGTTSLLLSRTLSLSHNGASFFLSGGFPGNACVCFVC